MVCRSKLKYQLSSKINYTHTHKMELSKQTKAKKAYKVQTQLKETNPASSEFIGFINFLKFLTCWITYSLLVLSGWYIIQFSG